MLFTKLVIRGAPFHRTSDPFTKLNPFTINMNCGSVVRALVGDMEFRTGTGLLMVKDCGAEVPPPGVGLETVTKAVPATAMSRSEEHTSELAHV